MKLCGFEAGIERPLFLIAGPCVVESLGLQLETAGRLKEICARLKVPFIFKSSYDKANRSSGKSFRGLGMEQGLAVLAEVRRARGGARGRFGDGVRARLRVRLRQPGVRHALAGDPAPDRLPGGVRR